MLVTGTTSLHAQLLEGDAGGGDAYVNEYSLTGQTEDAPLASVSAGNLEGIAVSGNDLFTADRYSGTVGEYNLSTGQAINSSFISLPFSGSYGIAVSGNSLYVTNGGTLYAFDISGTPTAMWTANLGATGGVAVVGGNVFAIDNVGGSENNFGIAEINATTGALVTNSLVSNLYDTYGLTAFGNNLYVDSYGGGTIGEYTTTGQTVNAALVTGVPDGANGMAVDNNNLYVADIYQVQDYNATTGAYIRTINTGMEEANSVAIAPEPSSLWLILAGAMALAVVGYGRKAPRISAP